ncbi:hypothetical protein [Thalassolituus marinus]|uniref:Uncharacterized protein n=1 Tax=Thalassolituus marinus TaxID=671053 RepID=A0ABS7ZQG7_9GAMM|nr:hypothetical protein [Thalassolituus marinus]MCA6063966.1 hypothetical protein [Thalassolituus marinus]
MKLSRLPLALILASPLAQAEFSNTSYSFFSAGAESVHYSEKIDNFGGIDVESDFSALNIVQRSGGYTAIDDRFGFFIKTASTLIASEESEDWDADGFSGSVQQDTAAMNFQMLDINLAYHLGNGGYWLAGVHYQKVSFSRFGWENTDSTDAFADAVETNMRADTVLVSSVQSILDGEVLDSNGAPLQLIDSAGNPITTLDEYFEAVRYNPEDTLDVVFEDASVFSISGGFEYDSYFANQGQGLRFIAGSKVSVNIYENLLNSTTGRSLTRSFGGGMNLNLTAGAGYQFTPEIGVMAMFEANASWRKKIREDLNSLEDNRTVELPDNTFYAYALTGTVFWNF